ncbi:MAG: hypothetical protein V3V13_03920 [Paracoccaceae bacterium]
MNPNTTIVKFAHCDEQTEGPVTRIVGFVQAKHILGLFDAADLDANPRSAKVGSVTEDIIESISQSAAIFPFKTKGVLIGASDYKSLQRKRYQLKFVDTNVEGILDGGHNMLAIGIHILSKVIEDERSIRRIKTWPDLKDAWTMNRDEIDDIKDDLEFLIPLEILVPSDLNSETVLEEFNSSLLDICAARNNNVQLTLETKANKKGFYEDIRKALPDEIAKDVEWKTNDGGRIKVRDLIALAWIPLNKLNSMNLLPVDISVSPQNIYRNKGECSKLFDRLMSNELVSKSLDGNYEHELHSRVVHSAIKVLGQIPTLHDKIYQNFPDAYNDATNGRFGRNPIVKMFNASKRGDKSGKYLRSQPFTKFTRKPVTYRYPEGLIMPLVYGLTALMHEKDGELAWKTDPNIFLDRWLEDIAKSYKLVLDMSDFDPQKIGKNETSYEIAVSEFEKALLKQQAANGEGN